MTPPPPQFGPAAVYFPHLVPVTGGVAAAILVSHWHSHATPNPWFVPDFDSIQRVTGLNRDDYQQACRQLKQRGILAERLRPDQQREVQLNLTPILTALTALGNLTPGAIAPSTDDPFFSSPSRPAPPVAPPYQFSGPWQSQQELAAFQKALFDHFVIRGDRNPERSQFWVIDGITKGMWSPFWEEFSQGQPLGSSQQIQRDWEIQPGVAYPAFEEERVQYYCQKGEPIEAAVARARADLRNPTLAQDLWDGFLRKCDRLAREALQAQQRGVATPYLPPAFSDRAPITKTDVMAKLSQLQTPTALPNASTPDPEPVPAQAPRLDLLQKAYRTKLGHNLIKRQIEQHPEWGYAIVEDQIVDLYPF